MRSSVLVAHLQEILDTEAVGYHRFSRRATSLSLATVMGPGRCHDLGTNWLRGVASRHQIISSHWPRRTAAGSTVAA